MFFLPPIRNRPPAILGKALVRASAAAALAVGLLIAGVSGIRAEVTTDSPEVQKVVNSALGYLESHQDPAERLGAECLIGLAFLKSGRTDHPRVREALNACAKEMKLSSNENRLDMYSNGLAIIFLCETSPQKNTREIEYYLNMLKARQKPHGGWGYQGVETGDTSQTQYGALASWEAHRHGFAVDGGSIEKLADWLMRTQAPDGGWGYQGQIPPGNDPIPQNEVSPSLLAAGLGSAYICADLLGMRSTQSPAAPGKPAGDGLPPALRRVDESGPVGEVRAIHPQHTSRDKLYHALAQGNVWIKNNYKIDIGDKVFYYLYGLERYKSFQEEFEGTSNSSPQWYNDGFQYLAGHQGADGSWTGYCGRECDTAFATLFLLRSTQKSIRAKLGEGMLVAGRGLPQNLSRAKLHNGQLIVDQVHTKVDELLSMIDDGKESALDDLANDPGQVVVDQVDEKGARRLEQLVHGGEAGARLLAVRALGRTGNLDYVPTLIYALTDPDRRVVIEARNGLQFIGRNFDGIGPPDNFTDEQRFKAVDGWKKWYKSIRPTAVFEK